MSKTAAKNFRLPMPLICTKEVATINYRQRQAESTRQLLFNKAIELFQAKGYENVSVEDIARAAQTSRACFYTYYKNKDDVLINYVHINDESYLQYYHQVLCGSDFSDKDSLEKLRALLNYAVDLLTSNGAHMLHLYFIALIKDPPLSSNRERHFFRILRILFNEAAEQGFIQESLTVSAFQEMALWVLRGACLNWASSNGALSTEHPHEIINQFMDCVQKKNSCSRSR